MLINDLACLTKALIVDQRVE